MGNDRLANGFPPTIPNGGLRCPPSEGTRAIHDGFATIRAGGGKRGRARSSPSVATTDPRPKTCPACCGATGGGQGPVMEPLWEERNATANSDQKVSSVTRRDPKIPWWEVATRRSKYRSCPAFSQANIVSALEQTVTDVTDRLERLASSPDLKESELEELRRSAAVLRRQSSAVSQSVSSGYFSLERQASCDSVSSVSSSISNVTHLSFGSVAPRIPPHQHLHSDHSHSEDLNHQNNQIAPGGDTSKNKKRSWLRASFRRAFGKQKRKRNILAEEQTSNSYEDTIPRGGHALTNYPQSRGDTPNRYFSCNSLHRERHTQHHLADMCKEHRARIANSNQPESLERLNLLVQEKERALMESKAELAAAQALTQKQNELIAKLQNETTALKEENSRLLSLVENKFGSLPDFKLNPLMQNLDTLTISGATGNYATVHRKGKRIKILVIENISLESASSVANICAEESNSTFAGSVVILPKTTWEELDNSIAETFEDYCSRIDPGSGLGLGRESLLCYKLAEALRGEGLSKPDLLPYGYCVGNVDGLYLWLKGPLQKDSENSHGSIASIAFQNGLPAPTLKNLLNLLQETRRVMLVGPSASGKTTIAKQLARGFVASRGIVPSDRSIVFFTVNENNGLDLCQVLSTIWPMGRSTLISQKINSSEETLSDSSSSVPEVLVIDDIHAASGVVETLQRCLPLSMQTNPVVIATSTNVPSIVTRLQVHCYFRWVGFSIQEEPVRGLLGRILRKPLLAAEDTSGISLPMVHRTVDWLVRLWLHLNSLISGCGADVSLGPTLLSDCPMDQEEARVWFTWKWNECLAPKFREILKMGLTNNWSDPKEWIVSTYPWTKDASALNQLQSIKPEETKLPSSPSFRINFPPRGIQSSTVKPQIRSIDSPMLPRPKGENRTVGGGNSSPIAENLGSPKGGKKMDPDAPVNMVAFSTFLKTSSGERDLSKINIDSFTPLLYRRDHNMNRDITGILMKNDKEKTPLDALPRDKEENRKFSILHSGLLKEVSL